MKDKIIAFYPYSHVTSTYIGTIQQMISERYFVIDYKDLRNDIFHLDDISAIYLNWIEDMMSSRDKALMETAIKRGVKVYWVFHNRVSHNKWREKECRENIVFLIRNVTDIIILSHASVQYLYEYDSNVEKSKIHYLPHQDYIGNYWAWEDKKLRSQIDQSKFVFGAIGSIRSDKNIELTIKAFRQFAYKRDSVLFIAGECNSKEYLKSLELLRGGEENIFLIPNRIPDDMMDFYVQMVDVVLLPYDLHSCINSGVMLLAFTNKRTVITSNISMAEEFDDRLIYIYSYEDEVGQMPQLLEQMERAYLDGKALVREKGSRLYENMLETNSKALVQRELYKILESCSESGNKAEFIKNVSKEYEDKYLWRVRYAISEAWLRDVLGGNMFIERLKDNGLEKIGIYGFGKYGKMLYEAMQKQGLQNIVVIDQNADKIHDEVMAYTLDVLQEKLDVVIVTIAEADMETIKKRCCDLNEKCYVLNLKDI